MSNYEYQPPAKIGGERTPNPNHGGLGCLVVPVMIIMAVITGVRNFINWVGDNPAQAALVIGSVVLALYGIVRLRHMIDRHIPHWSTTRRHERP